MKEHNDRFEHVSPHLLLQVLFRSDTCCPGLSDSVDVGVLIWTRAYQVCSVDSRPFQPVEQVSWCERLISGLPEHTVAQSCSSSGRNEIVLCV